MAIRPVDIQLSILQSPYLAGIVQQGEVGAQNAQAASHRRFAAEAVHRTESVAELAPMQRSENIEASPGGDRRHEWYLAQHTGPATELDRGHFIDVTA